jgi:predicted nucleic acid-binding protein
MKIVLDSNIIMADFWMESTNFTILFESARNGSIEIYIPEVVVGEVKNKYSQRLLKSKNDIKTELNKFNKLSKQNIGEILVEQNIDDAIDRYNKYFDKIVEDNKIQILTYPKVSHKYIAEKAMKKTKPFNANEKGYRDNLIWENIKDLLTDEELAVAFPELVFISNNHKDFTENNTRNPHPELLKELEEREFSIKSVV